VKLCKHCEVEVEEGARYCPLCRNPLHPEREGETKEPEPPPRSPGRMNRHIRRWFLEILTLLAVTGASVVVVADLASGMSVTWSRYPLAGIAFGWFSAVLLMFCADRAWIFMPAQVGAACAFLFALDRFTLGLAWFLPVALPVTLLLAVILALMLVLVRKAKLSPFATLAACLVAAGVFVVGFELILNSFHHHRWFVSWSAVAFVCMLPLVLMLLYLRKWIGAREGEIRKLLHL